MSRPFGWLNLWVLLFIGTIARPAGAANYTVEYEMDLPPNIAGGYYTSNSALIAAMTQGSAGSGSTFANGILHYVNGANGPVGYYWHPDQNPCNGETFVCTVDMMVKANIHTGGTKPVSMNWCEGGNAGWGMQLNPNSIALNSTGGNPLNCAVQTPPATDLTTFHRIRVVLGQGVLGPDYATMGIYNLDTGVTIYSPCTGNGGPAPGDAASVGSDSCATAPGSSCGGRDRNGNLCAAGGTTPCCNPGCDGSAAYTDCNPLVPTDGIAKGGFTIGTFTGSSGTQTDYEVEYFRVLMYSGIDSATTQIHRTPLTSGCTSVSPNVAISTSALASAQSGSPPTLVLHSKGTPPSPGTGYWYPDIAHPTYTIVAGDHLVYDYYIKNASGPSGSVDMEMSGGPLRDSGIMDQNGRSNHPGTNLVAAGVPVNTWYHRDFDLSSRAGNSISAVDLAHDTSSVSSSENYACNIQIINGSTLKLAIYDESTWVPVSDTSFPNNNGYTSTVGPEKVAPPSTPPAPPLAPVTVFPYIMTNYSTSSTINYAAITSDSAGNAMSYPWLTVSPASGTILADNVNDPTNTHATVTINATVSSGGLAAGDYTGYVKFTDGGCTAAAIRRIDLHVIGCSIQVDQPNIRFIGPCNLTPSQTTFTMRNNGASAWLSWSATQVNTSRPWLTSVTLSPASPGSIAPGGTVTATANIDWSQAVAGQGADIRFRASCSGDGSNPVDVIPTAPADAQGGPYNTITIAPATNSPAFNIAYDGRTAPNTDNSAGNGYKFEITMGINQGTAGINDPSDPAPTDNKYYQLNDQTGQATLWRVITNAGDHLPVTDHVGATVIARLKTSAFGVGLTHSNFNMLIYHPTITAAVFWGGTGQLLTEEYRNITGPSSDDQYHIIRLTSVKVPGSGNVIKIYLDENASPALTVPIPAGDVSAGYGGFTGFGFGTASNSATATIWYDWVAGTNAGAFAPGEELSCVGSLAPANLCHTPRMDADGDHDVDSDDFGQFQQCYSGEHGTPPETSAAGYPCSCFNVNGDSDISYAEFNQFVDCTSGPSVPWVASLDCPD